MVASRENAEAQAESKRRLRQRRYLTGIDWVTVQGGHILNSSIHDFAGDWATYLKGGTAYIAVAGNEFYNCHLGFSAGQATNFEIMQSPWLHYEVYDIKFVNNVIHDIEGNAVGVQGGYNILIAYNTAYRVAGDAAGFGMILLGRGTHGCQDTTDNGANNADTICNGFLAAGGWCPAPTNPAGDAMVDDIIPNRNVYVYNNIFYNPAGTQTAYATLDVHAPTTPPAGSQIPSPTLADSNLQIRGNPLTRRTASVRPIPARQGRPRHGSLRRLAGLLQETHLTEKRRAFRQDVNAR
ncbi:MAG: hypothetical protein KA354_16515 [Phycisphaerae bacterium]|nr:hypothetical protein [Phycisphaerae bacterium]